MRCSALSLAVALTVTLLSAALADGGAAKVRASGSSPPGGGSALAADPGTATPIKHVIVRAAVERVPNLGR
jgi:hypothetical protein